MSLAEPVSRPFPFLTRLAAMLRDMTSKLKALLSGGSPSGQLPVSELVDEAAGEATVDSSAAALRLSGEIVDIGQPTDDRSEQEKCAVSLPHERAGAEWPVSGFLEPDPEVMTKAVDQAVVALPVMDIAIVEPEPDDRSGREKLIRRRWIETGIKMWNPDINGAGRAALNIQGRPGVMPARAGERLPGYDKLEFRLIDGLILCEGVVIDPPVRRK